MGGCFGLVLEEVEDAGLGDGARLGLEEGGAGAVDALGAVEGGLEGVGLEELGELGEGEVVEAAELEGGC